MGQDLLIRRAPFLRAGVVVFPTVPARKDKQIMGALIVLNIASLSLSSWASIVVLRSRGHLQPLAALRKKVKPDRPPSLTTLP